MRRALAACLLVLSVSVPCSFAQEGQETGPGFYAKARSLHDQILQWEKAKNWEGLYDQAPQMRKEISENLEKAQDLTPARSLLLADIKYLKWQNAREQKAEEAPSLFDEFAGACADLDVSAPSLEKIKALADELSGLQDKIFSRRLYEIYVAKLGSTDLSKDELRANAEKFLDEGNAYLAKALFEAFLERFADDKEKQAQEMVRIADKFAHTGGREGVDPVFAEEKYKAAYEAAGIPAFAAASQYRRAFNLERLKEFLRASEEYKNLLAGYPSWSPKQEIDFRLGVLAAYALKDTKSAREYFLQVKEEFPRDVLSVSSLYQLGLLDQWEGQADKAKEFFELLLTTAQDQGLDPEKTEIVLLTKDRLKEIEEKKEIKYGLRLFLEGTFEFGKEGLPAGEAGAPSPLVVDLTGRPSKSGPGEPVRFVVTTSNPLTGCMVPDYSYEWSGEVGGIVNIPNAPELVTEYPQPDIKVTHVAVIGPAGLEGAGFELVQIQSLAATPGGEAKE